MAVERQVEADLCMNLTVHLDFQDLILYVKDSRGEEWGDAMISTVIIY